jgi:type IV pilus assembly protein PilB
MATALRQYIVKNLGDLRTILHRTAPEPNVSLGQILRRARLIDESQLKTALARQEVERGKHLGRILVELKLVNQDQVNFALAQKFGIPVVKLEDVEITPEVLARVPADLAIQYNLLPLGQIDSRLIVATENPMETKGVEALGFHTNLKVEPVMSSARDITLALSKYYSKFDEHEAMEDIRLGVVSDGPTDAETRHLIEHSANRKPIVRLLNAIVVQAVVRNASDIHIRPLTEHVALYYRIDGQLQLTRSLHKSLLASLVSRIKIIGRMNIAERRLPQDGQARLVRKDKVIDLRFSVLPTVHGESVVIRLLNRETGMKPLARLGFCVEQQHRVRRMISRPHGLILVTGPTGSGKTTTLYALLNEIKRRDVHILSVEDPVEYDMDGVEQVQVAGVKGYTFAAALRHFLRHDPDVIMVGEIRDEETARVANRAALTGHLVFSTLHTNDTVSSVTRLLDMGIEPYLLGATLVGVLAQRLVRVICPRCREVAPETASVRHRFGFGDGQVFYRGRGCTACHNTGYRGRTMICELLEVSPAIADLVTHGRPAGELREAALKEGMQTLLQAGLAAAGRGITSVDEAFSVCSQ